MNSQKRAPNLPVLSAIKNIGRSLFTTREIAALSGGSLSNTTQALASLSQKGILIKITRGLWAFPIGGKRIDPYSVIPFLISTRCYVSFISALHLYGIIEQIPQAVTLASTGHTKTVKTSIGTFLFHRIAPSFFKGFGWYPSEGNFLIAQPEKALVDCLYLSVRKKRQFGYFPELHFPKSFSLRKAKQWVNQISDSKMRKGVLKKLAILKINQ